LDSDKIFHNAISEAAKSQGLAEAASEPMDLEKLKSNVERGVYFRRVESPVMALTVFQKHLFRIWANPARFRATDDQSHKFDRLSRQALDEVRDGLGLQPLSGEIEPKDFSDTAGDVPAEPSPTGSAMANGKKSKSNEKQLTGMAGSSSKLSASGSSNAAGMSSSKSLVAPPSSSSSEPLKKKKKKRDRQEMEQAASNSQFQQLQPHQPQQYHQDMMMQPVHPHLHQQMQHQMLPQHQMHMIAGGPVPMMGAPMMAPLMPAPVTGASAPGQKAQQSQQSAQPSSQQQMYNKTPTSTDSDGDVRAQIKRLREDLDDAHSRIDVLIHLLREKVANPLIRGLDRAGR
jgi:hypothetical protein